MTNCKNECNLLGHSHLNACNMPVLYNRCKNEQHMFSLRQSWKLFFFFFPVSVTCYLNWEALSHTWFFHVSLLSPSFSNFVSIFFPPLLSCFSPFYFPLPYFLHSAVFIWKYCPLSPDWSLCSWSLPCMCRSDFPNADLTMDSCTKNLHCLENQVQTSGHNLESPSQPVCILLFKIYLPLYLYLIPLLCSHWVIQFSSTNDTLSQLCTLFARPLAPPLFTRHFVQIFT